MVISQEYLLNLKNRYETAQKLDKEIKLHRFHMAYAPREILKEIEHNLQNLCGNLCEGDAEGNKDDIFVYKCIQSVVLKDLGRNFIATEEYSESEKCLTKALELLEELDIKPETVITYVECLNAKGLLAMSNNFKTAQGYLDKAEEIYTECKNSEMAPLTIYDLFGAKSEIKTGMLNLKKSYTFTLYYKAMIYQRLKDADNSAWCFHNMLKRQLECNDFDPLDWCNQSAHLSTYFFLHNKFTESRHHLSAATRMFDDHREKMITDEMTEEQKTEMQTKFNQGYADLMRCWGKYGLFILEKSKERLMVNEESVNNQIDLSKLKIYSDDLVFESLDVASIESEITDKYCLTFKDAKKVFLKVQEWFNKSKEYYTSDGEATEYSEIIQDLASSFSLLAFFEKDRSNQCKLYKRKADLLEDIVKPCNPNVFITRAIYRKLWHELGLVYSKMLDIKLSILADQTITDGPTPHAVSKINQLCYKSINKFNDFLDSYKDKHTKEIPMSTLSFEDRMPILNVHFFIAQLCLNKISPDKLVKVKYIEESLMYHELFVKMCSDNKDTESFFKKDMQISRDMIEYLPMKSLAISAGFEKD